MSEQDEIPEIVEEEEEEEIPQVITDEFFVNVQLKIQNVIKELREKEQYQQASEFIRLLSVAENLQIGLKDEQLKNQNLSEQYVDASGRIESAMKISQKDQDTIKSLRTEVIETWKFSDLSKTREVEMAEKLSEKQKKLDKAELELKSFERIIEDTDISSLGKHKTTVLQECERLTEEVRELNKRLQVQRAYSDEIQKKLDDSLETNRDIYRQWDEATNEAMANKRKVETLTMKVEKTEERLEAVNDSMEHYKSQSESRNVRLQERERQLTKMRDELERMKSENTIFKTLKAKLEANLKTCSTEFTNVKHELNQTKNFLGLKEDENRKLLKENEDQLKRLDAAARKIATIEKALSKNNDDILQQRNEIINAEKERDSIRRSNDALKLEYENSKKKIEKLMTEIEKREEIIINLKAEKTALEESKMMLDRALKMSVEKERKAHQTLKNLHARLESVESEKSFLEKSMKELNDDLNAKTVEVQKLRLEMDEVNGQLKNLRHEHNLAVHQLKDLRADYQKCREREADVKDRLTLCKSQVNDANDKLTMKLEEIGNLQKKIQKLDKKIRELHRDLETSEDVLKLTRDEVKTVRTENKIHKDELRENDCRFTKMKGQLDKLLRERDLMANQMLRRTDESELLDREVTMLKHTIERSNGMYSDRLDDIKMMTNEIKSLRSQSNVLKRALQNTADMRHEVMKLHRKLNQERVKAKVLQEEMATPMNVHRWRKLSRFDPKRMDLLKKTQKLQQRALLEATKVAKSETIILALQKKVEILEKELKQQRCVETHKKLMVTRSQLSLNTKKMKSAIAIKRASDTDLITKDSLITQLQKALYDNKALLFQEKREKCKLVEKLRKLKSDDGIEETNEKFKCLGNGIKSKLLV